MNKIWLIIQREYLTRVRKRSFLLTTILVPLIIVAFYAVIIAIAISDSSKTDKVAVIDEANLFEGNMPADDEKNRNIEFHFIKNETEETFKTKYQKEAVYIPYGADIPESFSESYLKDLSLQANQYYLLIARMEPENNIELVIRGYAPPVKASNWYASAEDFATVYEGAGFDHIDARLIDRPTPVESGIAAWVTTFRKGWLDRAGVPEAERPEIGAAVADRIHSNVADYVRLRFIMRKPD